MRGVVSGINIQLPCTFFIINLDINPKFIRLMYINQLYTACIYELVGRTSSQGLFRTHLFLSEGNINYKVIDGIGMLGITLYKDSNYVYAAISQYCSCTIQCIGTSDMTIVRNPKLIDIDINSLILI